MSIQVNNNKKIIAHIAKNNIKYSKMRNLFTILTIVLSAALIMVMGLFVLGVDKAEKRKVEKVQHVIYQELSDQQIAKLEQAKGLSYLTYSKYGTGVEYKDKIILPFFTDRNPVRGKDSDMAFLGLEKGRLPQEENEIAVDKAFFRTFGKPAEIGTEVTIEFLHNVKETFVVSGIIDNEQTSKVLQVAMSQQYAENGSQLRDAPYNGIAKIFGAEKMSQDQFREVSDQIGVDCGIAIKNINENGSFVSTLSGDPVKRAQMMTFIGIGIGILLVSILVIYSIFYISVVGRIRQFGQLRTIGMTKKQLKKLIVKEGTLLSAVGIPVGLVIGGVIGYLIQPDGWSWISTLMLCLVVSAACLITVMFSIRKPAKLASKVAPIEAMKYSGYQVENTKKSTKSLRRNLTPFSLARISISRNKKRTVMAIISLGIGGILFMAAATFMTSTSLEDYSRQSSFKNGEFQINISENAVNSAKNGMTDIQINNPLDDQLIKEIGQIDGVKKIYEYESFNIKWQSHQEAADDVVTSFKDGEVAKDMLAEGTLDYDHLVDNDEIVIRANNIVAEIFGWQYKVGDTITFSYFDGRQTTEKTVKVGAIMKDDYRFKNLNTGWFLLPEGIYDEMVGSLNTNSMLIISTDAGKTAQVEKSLGTRFLEEPQISMDTLRQRMGEDKRSFDIAFGIIMGLSVFIICFSLINLINTLITSIVSRKREFAAIQSLGMTHNQLKKMIISEGLILAAGNLLITLVLGTIIGIGGVNIMRSLQAEYMHYQFPILYFLLYALVIIAIPIMISAVSINMFRKQSLVDRLRTVD